MGAGVPQGRGPGCQVNGEKRGLSGGARRFAVVFAATLAAALGLLASQAQAQTPACTISWVGDVDDNWHGATAGPNTNWTGDRIPDQTDFVCLNNHAAPYTVRLVGSNPSGQTGGYRIESDVTVVLEGTGPGYSTLSARQDSTNAGTIRMAEPSLLFVSNSNLFAGQISTLTNTGTISFPAGGRQTQPFGTTAERRLMGDFVNRGTISVNSSLATLGSRRAEFNHPAVPVDTLRNEGIIDISAGSKLEVFRSALTQVAGGEIRGEGQMNVTGNSRAGSACSEGSNSFGTPVLRLEGGSIGPGADVNLQGYCGPRLEFGPSSQDVTGNVDVSRYVATNGSTVGAHARLVGDVPAGVTIDLDGNGADSARDCGGGCQRDGALLELQNDQTNRGTISLNGPGSWLLNPATDSTTGSLTNLGTIAVTSGGGPGPRILGATIVNRGTISIAHNDAGFRRSPNIYEDALVSGGANYYAYPAVLQRQDPVLTNHGSINVVAGARLTVGSGSPEGDGSGAGNFHPATMIQDDGGAITGSGALRVFGNPTTLFFSGGTSEIPFWVTRNADLDFTSATGSVGHVDSFFDLTERGSTNVTRISGTVPVGVTIDVETVYNQFGSTQPAMLLANADWRNESTIKLAGESAMVQTTFPSTFTNAGTVLTTGPDASTQQRQRFVQGNATNDGLIDMAGAHVLSFISGQAANSTMGSVKAPSGATVNGTWTNAGSIDVGGSFGGSLTQTAGYTELSGGPNPTVGAAVMLQGGVMRGSGSFANFVNNTGGTISPGIAGPGTFSIFDYTQGAGGTYAVDVNGTTPGTQFDQMIVSRYVSLNGNLTVNTSGITPTQANRFRIIDAPPPPQAPTRFGQFSNVTQAGYQHGVIYNPDNVELGYVPECSDGRDNDSDGLTDFPQDNGCTSADDDSEATECNDNADNDGDGDIDFPADEGCNSRADDSENTESNPECSDEIDNDQNGQIDYPFDAGCTSSDDDTERDPAPVYNPPADQRGMEDRERSFDLGYFDDPGSGSPWEMTVDWGDGSAPEAFEWFPGFSATQNHTYADTGGYEVTVTVTEGDANPDSDAGTFNIEVTEFKPECSDEEDNDFDGTTDFPDDPGCNSANDDTEATESNPECSDERDNDGDGDIDFPADSACTDADDNSEESNTATVTGPIVVEGDSGTTDALFRITLSEPAREGASVQFDTYSLSGGGWVRFRVRISARDLRRGGAVR